MKVSSRRKKLTIAVLFTIIFFDLAGVGIIYPVLPEIFLGDKYLGAGTPEFMRNMLLGLLIASYPFAKFFGAPLLGRISDKYGRRNILMLSLAGTVSGYVLFAYGMIEGYLSFLFVGRMIDGFTAGNDTVAMSAIADLSTKKEKVKHFGLSSMAIALGIVLGPFIGGKLTDTSLVPWFTLETPFWFAALLGLINFCFILFIFRETIREPVHQEIHFYDGLIHLEKALKAKAFRMLFLSIFLLNFGWNFFVQFFSVFLFERFTFDPPSIGMLYAYMGLWMAFTQGFILRGVADKFKARRVLKVSMLVTGLLLPLILFLEVPAHFYYLLPVLAIFFGLTHPYFLAILSNSVDVTSQGEILGIQQSLVALGQMITALIAGFSLSFDLSTPFILSSIAILLSWYVFSYRYNPIHKKWHF